MGMNRITHALANQLTTFAWEKGRSTRPKLDQPVNPKLVLELLEEPWISSPGLELRWGEVGAVTAI